MHVKYPTFLDIWVVGMGFAMPGRMKIQWVHQVARIQRGLRPFQDREVGLSFWRQLQGAFPERLLAACLMPNHLHVVWATATPDVMRRRLADPCRAFTRKFFRGRSLWEPLPAPGRIDDFQKLETTLRYVHLNPCRARLTVDPFGWEFSTLPEHTLATLTPWVDFTFLAQAMASPFRALSLDSWADRHQEWVLQDSTVSPEARERLLSIADVSTFSLTQCLRVVERTLGLPFGASQRPAKYRHTDIRLLSHLKPDFSHAALARTLGVARATVREALRAGPLRPNEPKALLHHAKYSGEKR